MFATLLRLESACAARCERSISAATRESRISAKLLPHTSGKANLKVITAAGAAAAEAAANAAAEAAEAIT